MQHLRTAIFAIFAISSVKHVVTMMIIHALHVLIHIISGNKVDLFVAIIVQKEPILPQIQQHKSLILDNTRWTQGIVQSVMLDVNSV